MSSFKQKLVELRACQDATDWVGRKQLKRAWTECEVLDWLVWLARRLELPKSEFVQIACRAARSILYLSPGGDARPRLAVEEAERWLADPTEENRIASHCAASATYYAETDAAARAAYYVAYAAYCAASAAYGDTKGARCAANCAAYYAAAVRDGNDRARCDKFREFFPVELVKRGLGL